MLLHERQELAIDVPVADPVTETVDARLQELLAVFEIEDVRDDAHRVLVRFVDDRLIHVDLQLRHRVQPVVHPDLDHLDVPGLQFTHQRPALGFGLRAVRNPKPIVGHRSRHRRCRNPPAHREKPRGVWNDVVSQLVGHVGVHVPPVEAHAQRGRNAVVRVALQVIDHALARVTLFGGDVGFLIRPTEMVMGIDERGDDRLAGQIDTRGTGGQWNLALPADSGECGSFDEKRGAVYRSAAITRDEPRSFEQNGRRGGTNLAC